MTTKRTKEHKLFNKFLRENKCKREYSREFKKFWLHKGDFSIFDYFKHEVYIGLRMAIRSSFPFQKTERGYDYWWDISDKWEIYLNKHLR